jgi:hypothetical protein
MDRNGDHHVKQNMPDSERQILHVFSHVWNLDFFKDMKIVFRKKRRMVGEREW